MDHVPFVQNDVAGIESPVDAPPVVDTRHLLGEGDGELQKGAPVEGAPLLDLAGQTAGAAVLHEERGQVSAALQAPTWAMASSPHKAHAVRNGRESSDLRRLDSVQRQGSSGLWNDNQRGEGR